MRNLPTLFVVVGLLLIGSLANAQVRFGVKAGVNASNVRQDFGYSENLLLGYQGGLVADIGLSSRLSFQPALLYTTKGFSSKLEFRNAQGALTETSRAIFRANYLELPVLLVYKVPIGSSCVFFGGVGYYVAMGIDGKTDFTGVAQTSNIVFGPKNNRPEGAYNRMDEGVAAAAGLEMGKVFSDNQL